MQSAVKERNTRLNVSGRVALRSHHGRYLVAEPGGRTLANRRRVAAWEKWTLTELGGGTVALRSHDGRYLATDQRGRAFASKGKVGA